MSEGSNEGSSNTTDRGGDCGVWRELASVKLVVVIQVLWIAAMKECRNFVFRCFLFRTT